jgi:nicotinamide-nucleotide amidase
VVSSEERLAALSAGFALARRDAKLMVAESCTGGLVSHWLTAIAGSSHWFDGGVVSYANTSKIGFLGVSEQTLARYGAVSLEVAGEMADGLLQRHHQMLASGLGHVPRRLYAMAITGIAGPQGGQPGKPVGTVCFAWAGPFGLETGRRRFAGDRQAIQAQAAWWALAGLFARLTRT